MGEVTRYGRKFNFDEGTSEKVQEQRIRSWMEVNAPDELKSGATTVAADKPAADKPAPPPDAPASYNPKLAAIARVATGVTPFGPILRALPSLGNAVDRRMGDVNFYRTIGQGVIPLADEGVAKVRSWMPGGPDYDTALEEERKGVRDYADKYGGVESALLQGAGALATIPLTMGAGAALQGTRGALMAGQLASKIPMAGKVATWAANNPRWAQLASNTGAGAVLGGAGGFGAGEEGFANRAENAGLGAVLGGGTGAGVTAAGRLGEHVYNAVKGGDNSVANYLRNRLVSERDTFRGNPAIDKIRRPDGTIDTSHPDFANIAGDDLAKALETQRIRSMQPGGRDVMAADVLPRTAEGTMLKGGEDTGNLGRDIIKRHYDKDLPQDAARDQSQYGQVGKWFERAFGGKKFRDIDDQLISKRSAEAEAMFQPSYQHRIINNEIDDAVQRIRVIAPDVFEQAEKSARAARGGPRDTGFIDRHGEYRNYNTQFLHDIKRLLDKKVAGDITFDKVTALHAKDDLNKGMKLANPEYKAAMEKYGDTSDMIEALRKGKETVFGKEVHELDKGIGKQDIEAFLNDPNQSEAAKELFRIGGARALEQKLLGSDATKFSGNWADVLNNPNLEEKFQALIPPGSGVTWQHMRNQLNQLSDRHKMMANALGNSATAKRLEMSKELSNPSILGDIVATAVNPSAPSTWRHWVSRLTNPEEHSRAVANKTAKILGQKGEAGNEAAVQQIRDLLRQSQLSQANWNRGINTTARTLAYSGPPHPRMRHYKGQPGDEYREPR